MLNYFHGPWRLIPPNIGTFGWSIMDQHKRLTISLAAYDDEKLEHTARLVAATPEMYGILKDFCRFSPAADVHEIAALQSKTQMLLQEIEEGPE